MINEDEEKSGILVHFAKEEIWTISKDSTLMIFDKKGQQVLEFNYICPYKPTALIKLELENLIDVYYFFLTLKVQKLMTRQVRGRFSTISKMQRLENTVVSHSHIM